jgi:hypothetical protein
MIAFLPQSVAPEFAPHTWTHELRQESGVGPCQGDWRGGGGGVAYMLECPALTQLTHMPASNWSLPPGEVTYCLDAGEGGGGGGGGSPPRDQIVAGFRIPTNRSAALLVLQSPEKSAHDGSLLPQ